MESWKQTADCRDELGSVIDVKDSQLSTFGYYILREALRRTMLPTIVSSMSTIDR